MKEEWKFCVEMAGELYVMISGIPEMPLLLAANSDCLTIPLDHFIKRSMEKDLGKYGLIMFFAPVMRVP